MVFLFVAAMAGCEHEGGWSMSASEPACQLVAAGERCAGRDSWRPAAPCTSTRWVDSSAQLLAGFKAARECASPACQSLVHSIENQPYPDSCESIRRLAHHWAGHARYSAATGIEKVPLWLEWVYGSNWSFVIIGALLLLGAQYRSGSSSQASALGAGLGIAKLFTWVPSWIVLGAIACALLGAIAILMLLYTKRLASRHGWWPIAVGFVGVVAVVVGTAQIAAPDSLALRIAGGVETILGGLVALGALAARKRTG